MSLPTGRWPRRPSTGARRKVASLRRPSPSCRRRPLARRCRRYRASSINSWYAPAPGNGEHRRRRWWTTHHDGARLQMGGEAARRQDPAPGRHRPPAAQLHPVPAHGTAPARLRRAAAVRAVVGLMPTPQVSRPACRQARAAPMPIEPSPITQTLVSQRCGLLANIS